MCLNKTVQKREINPEGKKNLRLRGEVWVETEAGELLMETVVGGL